MTQPAPHDEAERIRAEVARRYGCVVRPDVPVLLIPRGVSGDPVIPEGERERVSNAERLRRQREETGKKIARIRRGKKMAALLERERRANKTPAAVLQPRIRRAEPPASPACPAGKDHRGQDAAQSRAAGRSRAHTAGNAGMSAPAGGETPAPRTVATGRPSRAKPPAQHKRNGPARKGVGDEELRALAMLRDGATQPEVRRALGYRSLTTVKSMMARLREAGHTWDAPMRRLHTRLRREAAIIELIALGERPANAARLCGVVSYGSAHNAVSRMRVRGLPVPRERAAPGVAQ